MRPQPGTTHILQSHNFLSATRHQDFLRFIHSASASGIPPDEQAIIHKQPHDSQEGFTYVRDRVSVHPGPTRVAVLHLCHDLPLAGLLQDPTNNILLLLVAPDVTDDAVIHCLL